MKILSRLALPIWCRRLTTNKPEILKEKGPLLLASNHPNSFLDSVLLDTVFQQPVWSLARGDVFKKPFYIKLLTALKILPVYRTSEGVENLSENYKTFEECITIFRKGGIITIYSEGKCINEWHLRPLKKGTARLAVKAWDENIPLKIVPVGINYSSFSRFGKNIFLNFGEIITATDIINGGADGQRHLAFNNKLKSELEKLVFEIPAGNKELRQEKLAVKISLEKRILLSLPALLGWLLHLPLFLPVKQFSRQKTKGTDHYDSVITGILLIIYPFYLILISVFLFLITLSWWYLLVLTVFPFTAWAFVQLKPQLD
ncbi:MAG TPA: 1-acyl-sn-glycerol-3-phosphate acyltransferase [Chitinophagaceae bacterium]|nr:1-acyl-sn-glycerol-3-phosphate acyltransferase [Chitinophagaceae bacterium]